MKKVLSNLIVALSDKKTSETLQAAAAMGESSLAIITLFTDVRAQQKEMFGTYQQIKGNFSAVISTLKVSISAALNDIPKNSSFITEAGLLVDRDLKMSYRLINAIEGNIKDKVSAINKIIAYFLFSQLLVIT